MLLRSGLLLESTVIVTLTLGVALQLIAARVLDGHEYATFVLGLAVGNIANGIASAVQPVVAVRVSEGTTALGDIRSPLLIAAAAAVFAMVTLWRPVGLLLAFAIAAQLPLHALVGIGQGRIQGAVRLGQLAVSVSLFAVLRILVVVPLLVAGFDNVHPFIWSLPASLLGTLMFLAMIGAFHGLRSGGATDRRSSIAPYIVWLSFYWLLNADAVYGRFVLTSAEAGPYAVAFTLGRLPVFLAAPLAMVLLPLARQFVADRRRALAELAGISILLGCVTALALGIRPDIPISLLAGSPDAASETLVRLHAWVGTSAACSLLLLTFVFALGTLPRSIPWVCAAATLLVGAVAASGSATALAAAQGVALTAVSLLLAGAVWSSVPGPLGRRR